VLELAAVKHTLLPFLLRARELLNKMHEDILNYNLCTIRPAVVDFAVEIERATVLRFFQENPPPSVGLSPHASGAVVVANTSGGAAASGGGGAVHLHSKTKAWLARACQTVGADASLTDVGIEAVVELVCPYGAEAEQHACPETCELDQKRVVGWRRDAALCNLAASVHTITRGAVPIGWGSRLVRCPSPQSILNNHPLLQPAVQS
jgi:hypothetical protein